MEAYSLVEVEFVISIALCLTYPPPQDDFLDILQLVDAHKIEVYGLTLASRLTLFGVGDTSDHVIAGMVSLSDKSTSHNNNGLILLEEVSHMLSKVFKMLSWIDHVL